MDIVSAGVDIGSAATKVVVMNQKVLASIVVPTGAEHRRTANRVMEGALAQADLALSDVHCVVATGYGRVNVPFADRQITEISCHARGIASLFPSAKTIIDIGGQDCKAIRIAEGRVTNFVMNDKCAAGTGRFLETISDALGVKLEDIGELSLRSTNRVKISSVCTVFAEQEVISRLSEGVSIEDILMGIHDAIAKRITGLVQRVKIQPDVVLTGGGAKNVGLVRAMEEKLGMQVLIADEPQLTGALGAAIIAQEIARDAITKGLPLNTNSRRLEEATFFDERSTKGENV